MHDTCSASCEVLIKFCITLKSLKLKRINGNREYSHYSHPANWTCQVVFSCSTGSAVQQYSSTAVQQQAQCNLSIVHSALLHVRSVYQFVFTCSERGVGLLLPSFSNNAFIYFALVEVEISTSLFLVLFLFLPVRVPRV